MVKRTYILSLMIIATIILNVGCSSKNNNINKIAYISANADSEYENTFEKLNLGILFDFNLKLLAADKSWVDIWVEGYSNGEMVEPTPFIQLSYGLSPKKIEEGHMGFGIINPNSNESQFLLYSEGIRTGPHSIDSNFFAESGISAWDYAIGSERIGLESGEEIVLAVYRQGKGALKAGYNYQEPQSIIEMIDNDITVLLLKIRVEEKNKL